MDGDIDWRMAPTRPRWLPARHHRRLVGQFIAGEQIALASCRRLDAMLDTDQRPALARQLADEQRHVALYGRYLARLGEPPGVSGLTQALEALDAWSATPDEMLLANHLLESEALAVQRELALWFPCPLLSQINRQVMRDEARHVALGRRLLAATARAPREARVMRYRRLHALWHDCVRAAMRDYGLLVFARVAPAEALAQRWGRHRRALTRLGVIDDADRAFADPATR